MLHHRHGSAATTLAFAEGTKNQHEAVIKMVRKYRGDLEEFGDFGFQIQNSADRAGRKTEYATLNEQQSTLLLTYMRTSDIVCRFKKTLDVAGEFSRH